MVDIEFRSFNGRPFILSGRFKTKPEAQAEQHKNNRFGTVSKVVMTKAQGGKRVYELWVKD